MEQIAKGSVVVRKSDRRQVRGVVQQVWVGEWGDTRGKTYCKVAWEGATNGARRFGSNGQWTVTTTVLAKSLKLA